MTSIFLCHNHIDKPFVRRLATDLNSEGILVWLDEAEINVGDSLIRKLSTAIDKMDYLGIVLSPDSVKSKWVQEELEQALHKQISEAYVVVLPLLLRDCKIPGFLRDKVYADFRDDTNYQNELQKLMRRINSKYGNLQQCIPQNEPGQERIGDILVSQGYSGILKLINQGEYKNELSKFITNQAVQPNLRIMALKAFIDSGQKDSNMFKQLLDDFDQEVRKHMLIAIREHNFYIDEVTVRKVVLDSSSSDQVIEQAVKLVRDLAIKKEISTNILLEEKVINFAYWLIPLCAISGIIGADEPDSIDRLSHYSGESYHVSRRKIREYFESLHDQGRLSNENRRKALDILQKQLLDGKSSETSKRKIKKTINKLSGKRDFLSIIFPHK